MRANGRLSGLTLLKDGAKPVVALQLVINNPLVWFAQRGVWDTVPFRIIHESDSNPWRRPD